VVPPTPEVERHPATAATAPAPAADPGGTAPGGPAPRPLPLPSRGTVVIAAVVLLAVPLVVALAGLRSPRWYPVLDLAQTEMRVRDVASSHPPLIGLVGRLGDQARPGSHPGPLSFWSMWPFYALAGKTAWALRFASASLSLLAMVGSLWLAARRGGPRLVLAVGATLAVVLAAYGPEVPVEAWNPFLPAFWWIAVLLGVWSVLDGDLVALPLTVFAASMCAQTHVSYLGLVGGMGVLTVSVLAARAHRHRSDPAERRRIAAWAAGSAALGLVLWAAPIGQQLGGSDPNMSIVWDDFRHPVEAPIGLRSGLEAVLANLSPARLFSGLTESPQGPLLPGIALLAVWGAAAVLAWRRLPDRRIVRLHAVLGLTFVLAVASARSIHGELWYYLLLWCWSLCAMMLLATSWTAWAWWSRRGGTATRSGAVLAPAAATIAVALAFTGVSISRAADFHTFSGSQSTALGGVVPSTVAYLDRTAPERGPERLLVTFTDPLGLGGQGWGLLDELVRSGFDARVLPPYGPGAGGPQHVTTASEADRVVHLAVGADIAVWDRDPAARRIAYHEPRTPAERAEYRRLRRRLIARLRSLGLADLVPTVDRLLFAVGIDPRTPPDVGRVVNRMLDLGLPVAVYVGPARLGR